LGMRHARMLGILAGFTHVGERVPPALVDTSKSISLPSPEERDGCQAINVGSYERMHLAEFGVLGRCAATGCFSLVCTADGHGGHRPWANMETS
jgi:hypothetical protein